MGDYLIKSGDTLSKIAKQIGTTVKQLQDANGIKNANLIFAGKTLKLPSVETDEGFKMPGWTVEKTSENETAHTDMATPRHTEIRNDVSEQVVEGHGEMVSDDVAVEQKAVEKKSVADVKTQERKSADNSKSTEQTPAQNGGMQSRVELSDALTVDEVTAELVNKAREDGTFPRVLHLKGETNEHTDYWRDKAQGSEMVCRDNSGKTQDIRGRFKIVGYENFEFNPEAFTITDGSSGNDHAYLYRKIGVNEDGKVIYKAISMNGKQITTDNQYTLEWKEDGTPELVQYGNQDNHGIGLKIGDGNTAKAIAKPKTTDVGETDGNKPPVAGGTDGNRKPVAGGSVGNKKPVSGLTPGRVSGTNKKQIEIWFNKMPHATRPGEKPKTLEDWKKSIISECKDKSRPLSPEEQKKLNACQTEEQTIKYLNSIGVKISFAF